MSNQTTTAKLNGIDQQLNELRVKFLTEASAFLKNWYEKRADFYVKEKRTDRTNALTKEQLADMKNELKKLIGSTDEVVNKYLLKDPNIWYSWRTRGKHPVTWPAPQSQPITKSANIWKGLDDALRVAMGQLAIVLEKKGYLSKAIIPTRRGVETWRADPRCPRIPGEIVPIYPGNYEPSEKMAELGLEYLQLVEESAGLAMDLKQLEADKEKRDVSDRWDSIQ